MRRGTHRLPFDRYARLPGCFELMSSLRSPNIDVPSLASTIVKAPSRGDGMKLRNSFNYRTFTGLTALLVSAGGTASAEPTLRMRPGPRRLAQAAPPAQTPPPAQVGQTPPAP